MIASQMLAQYQANLERYVQQAKRAGCARDQVARFLAAEYVAQPHQLELHALARQCDLPNGPKMILFGGRRGPGKTHATMAQVALDDCQRTPEVKFLFLRKVAKAARESFNDIRLKLFRNTQHEYVKHEGILKFANGSRIVLGHFAHESDIDQYLGIEYDGAAIEELTQLSQKKLELVRGSIRTARDDWRPRLYATTNPGGIGHQWVREVFILPWRAKTESETRFLPASHDSNVYLDQGYRDWLSGLAGVLGKLWRDGDWDVSAGAYFSNWSDERHVIDDATLDSLTFTKYWLAMDYGWTHWNVIYILGLTSQGQIVIIGEHYARRTQIEDHSQALLGLLDRKGIEKYQIRSFVAGTDLFSQKEDGHTIADTWAALGWFIEPANTDRIGGANTIATRLGSDTREPTLLVHRSCVGLIATLPMLLSDEHRPEDVKKVNADDTSERPTGDDFYDAFRYGIMQEGTVGQRIIDDYLKRAAK